ncbi:MAG: hypothetical protein PHQ11_10355, partial [Paludibacter sp.]|nr:hypothetical protein [Paludibacter sp.]
RLDHYAEHLQNAKWYCSGKMLSYENPELAAMELGTALHPLQDWVAHGDYFVDVLIVSYFHNQTSPQREFGPPSSYPDNPLLDAMGDPDGRPTERAKRRKIISQTSGVGFGGVPAISPISVEYIEYGMGSKRFNLTKQRTLSVLKDFREHLKEYGGFDCKCYFLN